MAAFLSEPPQILSDKGFHKYRRCNCDGGTDKFKNGLGLEVWIVKARTVIIKRGNLIVSNSSVNQLTTSLTEILNHAI